MGADVRITSITSKDNQKLKLVRSLRQRAQRQATGLFIVEGIRHVGEAVEAAGAGKIEVEFICFSPTLLTSEFALKLLEEQVGAGTPCYDIPAEVFSSLADKENPQGILGVLRKPHQSITDINPGKADCLIALVSPQDPGNIGTILRTIDAVGASGLLLLEQSADPYHPNSVRASMGALFWYPVIRSSFDEFAKFIKKNKYSVYGTSAHASIDYREVEKYNMPLVLLMGSEREGLSEERAAVCKQLIRLPMEGRASSLNLAVAAGVFLYDIYSKNWTKSRYNLS
jgi:RNA methyltransferase, TrmH family